MTSQTDVVFSEEADGKSHTYDSVLQGKWRSFIMKNASRNSYLKHNLPMSIWVRVARYLYPEENIKLSLITFEEYNYLHTHDGEFLYPPSHMPSSVPLPEWYDPDNFILNSLPWSKCPPHLRQRYFNLMIGIRVARFEGSCALLPASELVQLLKQNADTLERLEFSDWNQELSFRLATEEPIHRRIQRLLIPDDIESGLLGRKQTRLEKLKTLSLRGQYVLHWLRVLRNCSFEAVENVVVQLPPIIESGFARRPAYSTTYIRKLQTIVTRFFAGFPKGNHFKFSASPKDAINRHVVTACLQWIGSGSPSSKSFSSIELASSDLRPLLSCLNRHLVDVILKDGGVPDIIEDKAAFAFLVRPAGIESAPTHFSAERDTMRESQDTLGRNDAPSLVTREFGGPFASGQMSYSGRDGKNKGWLTTLKALRSLRSREPKLSKLKLTGVIGPWCEIVYLRALFGASVRIIADEFDGPLGDPLTGTVLEMVTSSLLSLRLSVCHATPFLTADTPVNVALGPSLSAAGSGLKSFGEHSRPTQTPSVASIDKPEFDIHGASFPSLVFKRLRFLSLTNIPVADVDTIINIMMRVDISRPPDIIKSSAPEPSDATSMLPLKLRIRRLPPPVFTTHQQGPNKSLTPNESRVNTARSNYHLLPDASPTVPEQQSTVLHHGLHHFTLELTFAESPNYVVDTLKSDDAMKLIKLLMTHFHATQLTVCPCPHASMFYEYQLLVRGTQYTLTPFTITRSGAYWYALTSDCHSQLYPMLQEPSPPLVKEVVLRSLSLLRWLAHLGVYGERMSSLLRIRTIDVDSALESLVGLSFAWDNINFVEQLGARYVDRLLQSAVDYVTLCNVVDIFSESLTSVTVKYRIPLDVHLHPIRKSSYLFLALKRRINRALRRRQNCSQFDVFIDVELRPLPPKIFTKKLPFIRRKRVERDGHSTAHEGPMNAGSVSHQPSILDHGMWDREEDDLRKQVAGLHAGEYESAQERFRKALYAMGVEQNQTLTSSSSSGLLSDDHEDAATHLKPVSTSTSESSDDIATEAPHDVRAPDTAPPENIAVVESFGAQDVTDPTLLLQSATLLAAEITPATSLEIGHRREELPSWLTTPEAVRFTEALDAKLTAARERHPIEQNVFEADIEAVDQQASLEYSRLCSSVLTDILIQYRYVIHPSFPQDVSTTDLETSTRGNSTINASAPENWNFNKSNGWIPFVWDSTRSYLDQAVISPPYPDGGSLILRITKRTRSESFHW